MSKDLIVEGDLVIYTREDGVDINCRVYKVFRSQRLEDFGEVVFCLRLMPPGNEYTEAKFEQLRRVDKFVKK